jgi:hypothetical protein
MTDLRAADACGTLRGEYFSQREWHIFLAKILPPEASIRAKGAA